MKCKRKIVQSTKHFIKHYLLCCYIVLFWTLLTIWFLSPTIKVFFLAPPHHRVHDFPPPPPPSVFVSPPPSRNNDVPLKTIRMWWLYNRILAYSKDGIGQFLAKRKEQDNSNKNRIGIYTRKWKCRSYFAMAERICMQHSLTLSIRQ